ncbi:hypothetical protein ['Camptotheca acuminata' phytoplasma]|uniref:hypothetical protein n=1 Tax='Camptotheca acuminata' phytoplasma TaxID=3239192 RepID=UPI00351AABC4
MLNVMFSEEKLFQCRLGTGSKVILTILSVLTLGILWFVLFPVMKSVAYKYHIDLQIQFQQQLDNTILELKQKINETQKQIEYVEKRNLMFS